MRWRLSLLEMVMRTLLVWVSAGWRGHRPAMGPNSRRCRAHGIKVSGTLRSCAGEKSEEARLERRVEDDKVATMSSLWWREGWSPSKMELKAMSRYASPVNQAAFPHPRGAVGHWLILYCLILHL